MKILGDKGQSRSYYWLADHLKLKHSSETGIPELIWINDPKVADASFETNINHNIILAESLFMDQSLSTENKERIERIFHMKNRATVGKYYFELSNPREVSKEIIQNYEALHHQKWSYKGPGFVIASPLSILVLQEGIDFSGTVTFLSDNYESEYYGYFEIIDSFEPALANYSLKASASGLKKLESLGLSPRFPALITYENDLYKSYYATGNLADYKIQLPHFIKGIANYMSNKQMYERRSDERVFWQWFVPFLNQSIIEAKQITALKDTAKNELLNRPKSNVFLDPAVKQNTFRTYERTIEKWNVQNSKWEPFYIKGVNLGSALPGKSFTEFPMVEKQYSVWLSQMKLLHINTIRVYTLMPPAFYKALYDFNKDAEDPIYLMQEIWPEEHPLDADYLKSEYNQTYQTEMNYVVGAIHGDVSIPKRSYRAYGAYAYDVSPYLLGYLVGREMEPEEVIATDNRNKGYAFKGDYFLSDTKATPTEGWLAESCDKVLELEHKGYGNWPLIGIVNWPTLDPIEHDSEWNLEGDKTKQFNDKTEVTIDHILKNDPSVNFFGAYHIYPNYPDFMNNEPQFATYKDAQGVFRYGGYLKAFMKAQTKYPAVVAEYGISTSMVTAHVNPDGLNHGGIKETDQADMIIRMDQAIQKEGYAGGIVFEWMDEWAKKTWTTEPFMIPYNRHPIWHNLLDPEQNYGLLAVKANPVKLIKTPHALPKGATHFAMGQNASHLEFEIAFDSDDALKKPFSLLFNTYSNNEPSTVWEYILNWNGKEAELLVNPGYNWTKNRFASIQSPTELYERMVFKVNNEAIVKNAPKVPAKSIDLSQLRIGSFTQSDTHIEVMNRQMRIRLPYGLLGISDPSSRQVLFDTAPVPQPLQDDLRTITSKTLTMQWHYESEKPMAYEWQYASWDEPEYHTVFKASFGKLADYFKKK